MDRWMDGHTCLQPLAGDNKEIFTGLSVKAVYVN